MTRVPNSLPRGAPFLLLAGCLLAASSLATACGGKKGGSGGHSEGAEGGPPGGGFPPAQVTVMTVEPRTVAVPYEFSGRLEGSREVEVRARVSGILLERTYEEGRPVKKGQTLFRIDPAPYRAEVQAAEAELAEKQAEVSRAEREVARLEPLLAERAVSRREYDNSISAAEQARAQVLSSQARLDQAKLDLSYTRVEAPISGVTSRAEHSEGSLVGPGEDGLLTRMWQVQPIWVRFSVPDQTVLSVRKGIAERRLVGPASGGMVVELVLADDTVHPERGQVNFEDSGVDATTGSVEQRAEISNASGRLLPGQFVRVRLIGIERPQAILVPQRAVQQGQQGKFVFAVGADGKAEVKPVEVGDWLGQDWVIESGLSAGDRVVVDGVMKVQPGAPVQVVEPTSEGKSSEGQGAAGQEGAAPGAPPAGGAPEGGSEAPSGGTN